jgi:hypothetical protein
VTCEPAIRASAAGSIRVGPTFLDGCGPGTRTCGTGSLLYAALKESELLLPLLGLDAFRCLRAQWQYAGCLRVTSRYWDIQGAEAEESVAASFRVCLSFRASLR